MRVLYFTRDYTPHDFRFLSSLTEHGHRVSLLRLERRGMALEERPLPAGVEPIDWAGGKAPAAWDKLPGLAKALRSIVAEIRPDVMHAGPLPTVAYTAALAGVKPLVSMSWGSDLLLDSRQDARARRRARFALKHSDVMAGDCEAVRNRAAELGFPPERVVLFPWGVDLAHFTPAERPAGQKEGFTLLSVRSWEPLYGVDLLVRAFVQAAAREPSLRLILLGGGSQETFIRETVRRAGLETRVEFGGQVSNHRLVEYYRRADLYISASHSDGSSVSLMEALACGLPVLVSGIPGNAEWITPNGGTGWLFPDGDQAALAEGMLRAFRKRESLPAMGGASRALAERRADWPVNYLQLERAYAMAVDLHRREAGA